MLRRLIHTIEQLDLALEHVRRRTPNDARFAMMLADNAVEISLHDLAKRYEMMSKSVFAQYRPEIDPAALRDGLSRNFDGKLRFAKVVERIDAPTADVFRILHVYRNDVYHAGLKHEEVLSHLVRFHLHTAGQWLSTLAPDSYGYSPGMEVPERTRQYFPTPVGHNTVEEYQSACVQIGQAAEHDAEEFAAVLASHLELIADQTDIAFNTIVDVGPFYETRDAVAVDAQELADQRHGAQPGNAVGRDPVPGWRGRIERLAGEMNSAVALSKYDDFVKRSADFRDALDTIHGAADAYVEGQIETYREGRRN